MSAAPIDVVEIAAPAAQIVTRTTERQEAAPRLHDPYRDAERAWTEAEDRNLIERYLARAPLVSIASAMQIDQRQVALRVIRLLLSPLGDVDDELNAFNHRARWSQLEERTMIDAHRRGKRLPQIANQLGRTQLGVGWRLLDKYPGGVQPSSVLRSRLGL